MPERLSQSLSGGPVGSKHLPWDISSILSAALTRPAVNGSGRGSACAADASVSTSPAAGTSVIARTRSACDWCDSGRLPSGSSSGGRDLKCVRRMPRRSDNGGLGVGSSSEAHGSWPRRRKRIPRYHGARGHAAINFPLLFATVPDVTQRYVPPAAAARVTAATRADRP